MSFKAKQDMESFYLSNVEINIFYWNTFPFEIWQDSTLIKEMVNQMNAHLDPRI